MPPFLNTQCPISMMKNGVSSKEVRKKMLRRLKQVIFDSHKKTNEKALTDENGLEPEFIYLQICNLFDSALKGAKQLHN